jgi:hypothetical protein
MRVFPDDAHVKGRFEGLTQGSEEMRHELGGQLSDPVTREVAPELEERTPGKI